MDREALAVVDRQLDRVQDVDQLIEQRPHRCRQLHVTVAREGAEQEPRVACDGIERHDRHPPARERVVGIVPLGALGVEPDAAAGDEVGELDEQRDQQLLRQRDEPDLTISPTDQPPVGSHLFCGSQEALVSLPIEGDGVPRVGDDRVEAPDPVGHVGVRVDPLTQAGSEDAGLVAFAGLEQPQEIDDLVVAPVADVAPGVIRVLHLPVDAGAADAVGVVPVCRRCVQEHGDELAQVAGIADAERLPVLEDVAPVALVAIDQLVTVVDADGVPVPRPARVAVAAAEGERQVAAQQACQLGVVLRHGIIDELVQGGPLGQSGTAMRHGAPRRRGPGRRDRTPGHAAGGRSRSRTCRRA